MTAAPGPIAILGATSQIARDFASTANHEFHLFGRSGETRSYSSFGTDRYSAIINFVGAGDPARAQQMGADIFAITQKYDQLALDYVTIHPQTRYIFLSSGAAYGSNFAEPVGPSSPAMMPSADLRPQDWYGAAKLRAENIHRSHPGTIFDLRIFNYISRTLDLSSRFLIADMINAARSGEVFRTSEEPLTRDYLHPSDFAGLVECCLAAPEGSNMALDCYTRAPITKQELIALMAETFGMKSKVVENPATINATGQKTNYYSRNHRAAVLGYAPCHSSHSAIMEEVSAILSRGS